MVSGRHRLVQYFSRFYQEDFSSGMLNLMLKNYEMLKRETNDKVKKDVRDMHNFIDVLTLYNY